MTRSHLFCFGLGYTALALASRIAASGWKVTGTCRGVENRAALCQAGFAISLFERRRPIDPPTLKGATHLLVSVPPDAAGDPVLDLHATDISAMPSLSWLGYLSTTGVYGDRAGAWVDEKTGLQPTGERGRRRVAAERGWLELWRRHGVPVHI